MAAAPTIGIGRLVLPLLATTLLVILNSIQPLLFHTLAELFAVLVALLMTVVVFKTHAFSQNNFLMYLGTGYLWVGVLDLMHALSFKGLPLLLADDGNLSIQTWIMGRYLETAVLLSAPFFLAHRLRSHLSLGLYGMASFVFMGLVLWGYFPDAYVEGEGLTPFKIASEYLIMGLLVLAGLHLWWKRSLLEARVVRLTLAAIGLTIAAEYQFTTYEDFQDLGILLGHIFKILSYWLLFIAVIDTTLTRPFTLLARGAHTFDAIPDAVAVVDKGGIIREVNAAAATMAGCEGQDLIGRPCHEIFHPGHYGTEDCPVCQRIAYGEPVSAMEVGDRVNGDWGEVSLAPIDGGHNLQGMIHVWRDISARKHIGLSLRKAQQSLAKAQQIAHIGNWDWDIQNATLSWSDEIYRIFGATLNSFAATYEAFLTYVHPQDREYLERAVTRALSDPDYRYSIQHRVVRPDGSERFVQEQGEVVRDMQGRAVKMIGTVHDITEHQMAEEALRESERYNRTLFEQSPIGLALCRMNGELVDVNPAYARILGRNVEETLKLSYWDITPRKYQQQEAEVLDKLEKERCYGPYEKEYLHKDGHLVPVRLNGLLLERANETYIWSSVEDITARKQAEAAVQRAYDEMESMVEERTRELAEANEQLKELDKLKSMFIASMSHELRTPLNSIIGFTGVILQGLAGELNETQRDQLERVYGSAKHLLALISDVIDVSRIEAGRMEVHPQWFSLPELIEEAVSTVHKELEKKGLALEQDVVQIEIYSDRHRLLQCLLNYISNAVKYSEAGTVRVSAEEQGEEVEISVTDTGIGLSEEQQAALFKPFVRISSHLTTRVPGTGLGLYLTRKIVSEILSGTVAVKSEAGKGSCFSLRIPKSLPASGSGTSEQMGSQQ